MVMNIKSKNLYAPISFCSFTNLLLFFGCNFFIFFASGQPVTNGVNPREIISFDENWRFWNGDDASAKEATFDDSHGRILTLPHCNKCKQNDRILITTCTEHKIE